MSIGFCVLAALGFARVAAATQGGDAVAAVDAPDRLTRANRLYDEAALAAKAGELRRALALMQQSHQLSGYPELHFNIGKLHQDLGDCAEALQAFSTYLRDVTEGTRRNDAQARVDELRPRCGIESAPAAPPAPAPPQPAPPEPVLASRVDGAAVSAASMGGDVPEEPGPTVAPPAPGREARAADAPSPWWTPRRTAGGALIAAGTFSAGVAAFYGFSAQAHDADLASAIRDSESRPGDWSRSAAPRSTQARDADRTRALVASAAAGALLGAGLLMVFLPTGDAPRPARSREPPAIRAALALRLAPSELFLEYSSPPF